MPIPSLSWQMIARFRRAWPSEKRDLSHRRSRPKEASQANAPVAAPVAQATQLCQAQAQAQTLG
eukprot:COSAG06_NODE_68477_length_223_cov_4.467742_1_plen_63_part_01